MTQASGRGVNQRFSSLADALVAPEPLTIYQEFLGEGHRASEWIFSPPFLVKDRFEEVAALMISNSSPVRSRRNASAICVRQEFEVQRNNTLGLIALLLA
jgi:hypothetical protein